MSVMTIMKGKPVTTEPDCKERSPPPSNKATAAAPTTKIQNTACNLGVSVLPPADNASSTKVPESQEVTKKIITSRMPTKQEISASGNARKALRALPLAEISCFVGILLVMIFFVTSWDSGTLVLDALSAGGKTETPKLQAVFWIFVVGAAAVALLLGGGLRSLQSGSVVTGLPFMIVITLICVGTLRGLVQARRAQEGPV